MRKLRCVDPSSIEVTVHRPPRNEMEPTIRDARGPFELAESANHNEYDVWTWLVVKFPAECDVCHVLCSWRWKDQGWGNQKGTILIKGLPGKSALGRTVYLFHFLFLGITGSTAGQP
jgi:hypothetical protein